MVFAFFLPLSLFFLRVCLFVSFFFGGWVGGGWSSGCRFDASFKRWFSLANWISTLHSGHQGSLCVPFLFQSAMLIHSSALQHGAQQSSFLRLAFSLGPPFLGAGAFFPRLRGNLTRASSRPAWSGAWAASPRPMATELRSGGAQSREARMGSSILCRGSPNWLVSL